MKKHATSGLVLLAFAGSMGGAVAAEPAKFVTAPWYVGLGIGKSYSRVPTDAVQNVAASLGDTVVNTGNGRESSTEGKIFAGFQFDPHLAIELGYASMGHAKANPVLATHGPSEIKYTMSAPFLDVLGGLPLNDAWSLFARAGVTYARASVDAGPTESKIREKFGAGVGYNFTPVFGVRAEWENYRLPDPLSDSNFRVNAVAISALLRF